MKKILLALALASSVSMVLFSRGLERVHSASAAPEKKPNQLTKLSQNYGQLPLRFEPNRGQTDKQVRFLARGPGYGLFLTENGAVLRLRASSCDRTENCSGSVLRLNLLGARTPDSIAGRDEFAGTSNYFVGNDPAQWRTQVPNYARVEYDEIYPGIDVVYYGQQQQLEYDFVVAPQANPNLIRW